MKDEKELYQKLRDMLAPCDFVRIENGVGTGLPDINACYKGCEIWIEAKMTLPQGVLLRKFQHAWCLRRHAHGGIVYVIAYAHAHPNAEWPWPVLNVWKYVDVGVMPQGEYLKITTLPTIRFDLDQGKPMRDYLFET